MCAKSLRTKTKEGLLWNSIDKLFGVVVQFGLGVLLARLLTPEDYGLLGMIAIFLVISQCLVDSGFYTALVQKKTTTQRDYSTIFYFNVLVAFLLSVILWLLAPYIALFFEYPILDLLIKISSLNIIIQSTTVVYRAILARLIDFKMIAIFNLIAIVVSGTIGVVMALYDYGVWSLIGQQLSRSLIFALLLWFLHPWKPDLIFDMKSLKSLFAFGSNLMFSELAKLFFKHSYSLVIGKLFAASTLGFFTRAMYFKQIPGTLVNSIIQGVTFPVMVKIIDDSNKVRQLMTRSVRITGFILFPVIGLLIGFAKPLILFVLTEKWAPTIPLLQILALEIIFHPLQYINLNFLNAKGRSDLFLKLELIRNLCILLSIFLSFPFGIIGMTIGYTIASFFGFFINTYYTNRFIGYSILLQLRDLSPYAIASSISIYIGWIAACSFELHWVQLSVGCTLSAVCYLGIGYILNFDELREISKVLINSKFNFFQQKNQSEPS